LSGNSGKGDAFLRQFRQAQACKNRATLWLIEQSKPDDFSLPSFQLFGRTRAASQEKED
jgi:hypothetical protein